MPESGGKDEKSTHRSVSPGAGARAGKSDVKGIEEDDGGQSEADPEESQQGLDKST